MTCIVAVLLIKKHKQFTYKDQYKRYCNQCGNFQYNFSDIFYGNREWYYNMNQHLPGCKCCNYAKGYLPHSMLMRLNEILKLNL